MEGKWTIVVISILLVAGFVVGFRQQSVVIAILLGVGFFIGRSLVGGLKNEHRKIVGGVSLLIGAGLIIYGLNNAYSLGSQANLRLTGQKDVGAIAAIVFGILSAVTGLFVIALRPSKERTDPEITKDVPSTKKCPYCAEMIQFEAKICRYCKKTLETTA